MGRGAAVLDTGRESDRVEDQPAAGEIDYVLYENLRARPRAWVVPEVVALGDADALATLRAGQRPDGAPFDPGRTAIVPPGAGIQPTAFAPESASAQVEAIGDGVFDIIVDQPATGLLVLSETYYPGWRASIDRRRSRSGGRSRRPIPAGAPRACRPSPRPLRMRFP